MTDFEPSGLGKTIFEDRYARSPEETWSQACQRVSSHVAEAEENGKVSIYSGRFYDQLVSNKFCPGGRIWYGAGRPKAQLLNCFVIPTADSREGWAKTTSDVIIISSLMGGVGINVSPIRPRGSAIKGTGGNSTGSVSLMQLIDSVGDVICGGGGRRMALMLCLDINHPDMEEFLESKLDLNQLNNANISLMLPSGFSAEDFVELVETDGDIDLIFNGVPSGKVVKAKQLWERLVDNAWSAGEPGILNGDLANKMNNIWYHQPLISTNPCFSGDTLIAVADGRRAVPISALADEGRDVLVYSVNSEGKVEVKWGRNPRLTGQNSETVEVILESECLTVTPNHKFILCNGKTKEAKDLEVGDEIPGFLVAGYQINPDAFADPRKVIEVKESQRADVYNITVDGNHTVAVITASAGEVFSGVFTRQCGEIFLEKYGCCDLGALVLPRFVKDGEFQWDDLDESVRLGVRFLDNVLTVNHYPLPEIKENCDTVRRVGLGVMGLHSMLLELGMKYDDPEAFKFVDQLLSTIKNTAYDASINLAIEKGPFPAYDPKFLDSGFAKTLKRGIRNKIKEHGIRNCASLTIAPTGTTSMVSGVSSGIEPLPPSVYWRNYFKPSTNGHRELATELVVEESFYKYPDLVQSAIDVPVRSHFEMQKIVQKHIDNAVSKTINLAKDFPKDAFGDIWLEYLPYLKGTTLYRYGSRENEPINPVPREQWDELVAEKIAETSSMTEEEFMSLDCPDGACDLPQPKIEIAVGD